MDEGGEEAPEGCTMSRRNIRAQRREADESRWIGFAPDDDDTDEEPEAGQWELPDEQEPGREGVGSCPAA